ncbi:LysM peptidoglycan-binding domain-containing protein [Corallococcus macrosporus]|uniref:LysM peptidoglycan-binding domain-containing protein n=1 Tax=Corallococcus macrosporus TaxID=35 RepID=A0ABS3DIE1_9BACT|nr:LysM peptidoglycan-binding domain-containing protein [Corallococcus macrosporus]
MPGIHVVNESDGLSSLWLIAKHYKVPMSALEQQNPLIMGRLPSGHRRRGWLQVGDKVYLPLAQEEVLATRHSKPSTNTPWTATSGGASFSWSWMKPSLPGRS